MTLKQKLKVLFTESELKTISLLFAGILITAILETFGVASIAPFIAVISTPEIIHENSYLSAIYKLLNLDSDNAFIILLGVVSIVMILLSNSSQAFVTWKITYFTQMQQHRLQVRLLQQYLAQPYSFYLEKNTSELGKNILNEVNSAISGVVLQTLLVISKLIVALFLFGLLLFLDPIVAITVTIVLVGSYWLIFTLVKKRLHTIGTARTVATFQTFKTAYEAMSGIKEIKLRNSEQKFIDRFVGPSEEGAHYAAQNNLISSLPRYLLEVVAFCGIIVITISIIGTKIEGSSAVIPIISLYAMAGYRLMPALQQIYSGITRVKYSMPAFNILINDFSRAEMKIAKQSSPKIPMKFNNILKIKEISFSYDSSKSAVIKKLNMNIDHNTTVGLVGETGSGKTTLADVLLGLLTPETGTITVDGVQINQSNISEWQKNLGYVPQAIYLTDDTIEHNIAFSVSAEEVDSEQVQKVAKMANMHEFILTLPEQYQTIVGERGVRLSGGQRQRIGIARALYHNPTVLVLDEATSALDSVTENVIMDAIHNLSHKKTIIMIAHRLSTVKECDVIHFMKDGQIVESGSYRELLSSSIEFQRMVKTSS
jgi:ABC-type multidrug transport system fused ATPase/permease subunit